MILKRIKILTGFRGLPPNYEICISPQGIVGASDGGLEPICLVGLNGSGKSNILEVLAEIFYYLETYHKVDKADSAKLKLYKNTFGFEIEYYLPQQSFYSRGFTWIELQEKWDKTKNDPYIKIVKLPDSFPSIKAIFNDEELLLSNDDNNRESAVLPTRVIAYSSGMNELLSNPFIKMDFQYLEDLLQKTGETKDSKIAMNRLFFLNNDANKLITISNFLFDANDFDMSQYQRGAKATDFGGINLAPLKHELKINDLTSFTISLNIKNDRIPEEETNNPQNSDKGLASELNLTLDRLERCASHLEVNFRQTKKQNIWNLTFYFWVNKATKEAFREEFGTAYNLFKQFYFLNLLNHGMVSRITREKVSKAKARDYDNLSDAIPKFEKEELIFDISNITFTKKNKQKVGYRQLSDGEHQLLQVIGNLLLMDTDGALFLYDEPETHFNPDWRSKFVQLLSQSIDKTRKQELILTTHSPYIVSDCKKENVFMFSRDSKGKVKPAQQADIKTFGTAVSILTDKIFSKEESISGKSLEVIKNIKAMSWNTLEEIQQAKEASRVLGESPEKVLLFRELIIKENELKKNA